MKRFLAEVEQVGAGGIRAVGLGTSLLEEEAKMFEEGKFEDLPEAEPDFVAVELDLVNGTLTIGGTTVGVHTDLQPGDWLVKAGWLDSKYKVYVSDGDMLDLTFACADEEGNLPGGLEFLDPDCVDTEGGI